MKKAKKITSRFTSDILAGFDPPQIERANSETDLNNVSLDIDQLMTALNESRGASRHAMHSPRVVVKFGDRQLGTGRFAEAGDEDDQSDDEEFYDQRRTVKRDPYADETWLLEQSAQTVDDQDGSPPKGKNKKKFGHRIKKLGQKLKKKKTENIDLDQSKMTNNEQIQGKNANNNTFN